MTEDKMQEVQLLEEGELNLSLQKMVASVEINEANTDDIEQENIEKEDVEYSIADKVLEEEELELFLQNMAASVEINETNTDYIDQRNIEKEDVENSTAEERKPSQLENKATAVHNSCSMELERIRLTAEETQFKEIEVIQNSSVLAPDLDKKVAMTSKFLDGEMGKSKIWKEKVISSAEVVSKDKTSAIQKEKDAHKIDTKGVTLGAQQMEGNKNAKDNAMAALMSIKYAKGIDDKNNNKIQSMLANEEAQVSDEVHAVKVTSIELEDPNKNTVDIQEDSYKISEEFNTVEGRSEDKSIEQIEEEKSARIAVDLSKLVESTAKVDQVTAENRTSIKSIGALKEWDAHNGVEKIAVKAIQISKEEVVSVRIAREENEIARNGVEESVSINAKVVRISSKQSISALVEFTKVRTVFEAIDTIKLPADKSAEEIQNCQSKAEEADEEAEPDTHYNIAKQRISTTKIVNSSKNKVEKAKLALDVAIDYEAKINIQENYDKMNAEKIKSALDKANKRAIASPLNSFIKILYSIAQNEKEYLEYFEAQIQIIKNKPAYAKQLENRLKLSTVEDCLHAAVEFGVMKRFEEDGQDVFYRTALDVQESIRDADESKRETKNAKEARIAAENTFKTELQRFNAEIDNQAERINLGKCGICRSDWAKTLVSITLRIQCTVENDKECCEEWYHAQCLWRKPKGREQPEVFCCVAHGGEDALMAIQRWDLGQVKKTIKKVPDEIEDSCSDYSANTMSFLEPWNTQKKISRKRGQYAANGFSKHPGESKRRCKLGITPRLSSTFQPRYQPSAFKGETPQSEIRHQSTNQQIRHQSTSRESFSH